MNRTCMLCLLVAVAGGCKGDQAADAGPKSDGRTQTGDTGVASDKGATADKGVTADKGASSACAAPKVNSLCGQQGSIVRALVRMPAGSASVTGALVLKLSHYRLGQGSSAGVPHTETTMPGVTLSADKDTEIHLDMCSAGAMWSEENCEFNLWAFVDKNGNKLLDAGEPAARATIDVSCKAAPTCTSLTLSCTTGATCASFNDPAGGCKCKAPGCNSSVKTCS